MSIQAGMQVGDYKILRELGAGGMGKVFQVRNIISDRVEAMKVLLPDLAADPGLGDRFLREIKVQAALEHPNIAGLRTAVRESNQLLMVMEFVEGHTVEKYLEQGPVPVENAVGVCMAVLDALDYAHQRGIVHRDIKPANMMITNQGVVKLMDFGIARVMSDPSLTQTNQTTGSLYYMSPEQINGVPLDGRSDLYSLAVSLYQMVTGVRPFDGTNTYAIMAAHLQTQPVPPVQHDPRVPAALSEVILMGLAKDPNARFQTATAFRNALARVLHDSAVPTGVFGMGATDPANDAARVPAQASAPVAAKSNSGSRVAYILAGSLATVAVLAVLATQAPKFFKSPQAQIPEVQGPADPQAQTPIEQRPQSPVEQPQTPAVAAQEPANPVQPRNTPRTGGQAPTYSQPALQQPQAAYEQPQQRAQGPAESKEASQPVAPVAQPAAPAVDMTAINELKKRTIQMAQRYAAVKSSLTSLKQEQARMGLGLRGDLVAAEQRVSFEMDQAEAALNQRGVDEARQHLDQAERALEKLEKALNL